MLGDVPTRWTMLPSSEAKAIGIRKTEGDFPVLARELVGDRQHHGERTDILDDGRHHGDRQDEGDDLRLRRAQRRHQPLEHRLDGPERATAALTTSALATMMTISSEKPLNASLAGTTPSAMPASSATRATTSTESPPQEGHHAHQRAGENLKASSAADRRAGGSGSSQSHFFQRKKNR